MFLAKYTNSWSKDPKKPSKSRINTKRNRPKNSQVTLQSLIYASFFVNIKKWIVLLFRPSILATLPVQAALRTSRTTNEEKRQKPQASRSFSTLMARVSAPSSSSFTIAFTVHLDLHNLQKPLIARRMRMCQF